MYYENFCTMINLKNDKYFINLNIGASLVPLVAVSDIGKMAAKIFSCPELIGKEGYVSSCHLNGYDIA